ncbi:PREDICTED: N-myc-interactor isoform X2 [Gavialis gangeticus]|uniref:N-myc-interactor isoform X2 n=1 Tax=Gavialis gangeticus TaxID=94835 RepID=UPI00092F9A29|nr:PREDICTED: N-myc-interactor isoform X2 [Gavialis gangeticus]
MASPENPAGVAKSIEVNDLLGSQVEVDRCKEEWEKWKEQLEKAEKAKAELLLSKLSCDAKKETAQDMLIKLRETEEEQRKETFMIMKDHEKNLEVVEQQNIELKREIQKLKDNLAAVNLKLAEMNSKCSQVIQIKKEVSKKKMKFTKMENAVNNDTVLNTHCLCCVAAKIPFKLKQGEALLTFEDEDVAQKLIEKGTHTVNLDNGKTEVKAKPITLETGVKFELHVIISGKKINVSEVPDLLIPDEWMRDKLELNFYKSKGGGGEVENVEYDRISRTAVITFLRPGVADNILRHTKHPFQLDGRRRSVSVSVSPVIEKHLEKFQAYFGISTRTILLSGIQEVVEDEESTQDIIEIHFQKQSNGGGEIENITYVSNQTKQVCFEEDVGKVA